jgi:hypothetical protein
MTLNLQVGVQVLLMTYHLIIVTICAKYFQNPLIYEEAIDLPINYVNILPLSVTLKLEVGMQVLRMTHCLINVTICAKYFQNPLIYEKISGQTHIYPITYCVKLWPWR